MIPQTFTVTSSISVFTFLFFSVLQFLVVVSVRYIKLTHVGFRAHVKIASRIVSYRSSGISWTISCKQSAPRFRQITTSTLTQIFTGRMLFATPNQQCQSTGGYKVNSKCRLRRPLQYSVS